MLSPLRHTSRPVALVIGTGFGGLAAAIRLSLKGYDVQVYEKLDGPGGRAYVHQQDGFTFDMGPTIITAPFLLRELWTLCGRNFDQNVNLIWGVDKPRSFARQPHRHGSLLPDSLR